MNTKYEPLAHGEQIQAEADAGANHGAIGDAGERRERQQHFERVMIDKADQRAIEKVSGQHRGEESGDQPGAAIERQGGERPDRQRPRARRRWPEPTPRRARCIASAHCGRA